MTDGLKPKHRTALIETLAANPKVDRIVLFGSRAMGTFTTTSDVDVALFGSDLTLGDQAALAEAVAELPIPQRVDILIYHRIENEALREHIRKHGVEWFSRKRQDPGRAAMGEEWRNVRFGEMASLVRNAVQPHDAKGFPYIGLEHIGEGTLSLTSVGAAEDATSTKNRFVKGDILFGKLRPHFRKVVRAPFDGVCSTDIWVVRAQPGVDTGFLFYLMASELFIEPVVRASEGTKMPRAKWEYAASLDLPLPPLPEQRAIAHILGTLDDKIELNQRMSETLEAMARALFKAWFVDFEPVRAKMEGRWQRGQSLPGLPAHLYDIFPDRLVESELGEIPEGWDVGRLGDVAQSPRRTVQPDRIEPDTPYIALEHMPRHSITLSDWSTADGLESNKFEFKKCEILFGKLRPYFHKVGVAPVDGVCSTDIVVVTPILSAWFGFVLGHVSSQIYGRGINRNKDAADKLD